MVNESFCAFIQGHLSDIFKITDVPSIYGDDDEGKNHNEDDETRRRVFKWKRYYR